jgi:hypothetical protein
METLGAQGCALARDIRSRARPRSDVACPTTKAGEVRGPSGNAQSRSGSHETPTRLSTIFF